MLSSSPSDLQRMRILMQMHHENTPQQTTQQSSPYHVQMTRPHHSHDSQIDYTELGLKLGCHPMLIETLELACQNGRLPKVQSIVSLFSSPAFLYHGLVRALEAGQVEIARWVLSQGAGAHMQRNTPWCVLKAPVDKQIPLFEVLVDYGWTPNTPGYRGEVLLPRVVTNLPLLTWFLDHGADPNLGCGSVSQTDIECDSGTNACDALEIAASKGTVESIRMLLDAGAKIENGAPLHRAASVCPPDTNHHGAPVRPSKEFDEDRIPIMELLVERGADVNQSDTHNKKRYTVGPSLPLVYAAIAGAVARAQWLLERGANPKYRGNDGFTAIKHAEIAGHEEMIRLLNSARLSREDLLKPE